MLAHRVRDVDRRGIDGYGTESLGQGAPARGRLADEQHPVEAEHVSQVLNEKKAAWSGAEDERRSDLLAPGT
jgi:hypothetical protein